ncbi:tetranectin [Gadus morhua]|uniref:C-type lectin domain family 3 member B n=1 Tax=Gadus morhua TaxID=8049 RepID=A0A8C5F3M1_GADMO|nr:tetranectin-like [Gadus morhua]XP_056448616.1 tetranectin [Gadus chalcogrammus]
MLCSHDRGVRFTSAFGQVLAATQHFGVSPAVHENSPNVAFKSVFVMDLRGASLILCLLLLVSPALQQTPASAKKKNARKEAANNAVIEKMQKQIDDILEELNLLKEHQALQTVCLRGTKVLGKCFLADPVKKNYHAASEDCVAKGGSLGTPVTGDENDRLYEYVLRSIGQEEHVWLGINDMITEGQWVDQSGQGVRFKNWETVITLQPDGGRGQNCAIMSTSANGKWFDENCRAEKVSVCEFNIV